MWFRKENFVFLKWRDIKDVCVFFICYVVIGEDRIKKKKRKWLILNIEYFNIFCVEKL